MKEYYQIGAVSTLRTVRTSTVDQILEKKCGSTYEKRRGLEEFRQI